MIRDNRGVMVKFCAFISDKNPAALEVCGRNVLPTESTLRYLPIPFPSIFNGVKVNFKFSRIFLTIFHKFKAFIKTP